MEKLSQEQMIREIKNFSKQFSRSWRIKISQAINFSLELHKEQKPRYDGTPYFNHVLRVTVRAIRLGLDDPAGIIGALLHDSVEDQAKKLAKEFKRMAEQSGTSQSISDDMVKRAAQTIVEKFGEKELQYVGNLTIPKWQYALEEEEKNKLYSRCVENLFKISRQLVIIKLADFLDNACSLSGLPTLELKQHGAKKYRETFQLFINRIAIYPPLTKDLDEAFTGYGLFIINDPLAVVAELQQGLNYAEEILKA